MTNEQIDRYESIKDHIIEGYGFDEYILNGTFPEGQLEEGKAPTLEEMLNFVGNTYG